MLSLRDIRVPVEHNRRWLPHAEAEQNTFEPAYPGCNCIFLSPTLGGYWFCDECFADLYGPYDTLEEAQEGVADYAATL